MDKGVRATKKSSKTVSTHDREANHAPADQAEQRTHQPKASAGQEPRARSLGAVARARLMAWYREHQRQLPWRASGSHKPDPYRVLVSEIMLQQTQVDVVRPRYLDFVEAFPDAATLAAAAPESVREQWSGLGYYRRAESLQAAAKSIVELGEFPQSAERLRQLPGVGEYTAAAIASIAFGEAVAVLDGNVERVLARVRMVEGNPKHRAPRRTLQAVADALLDRERPGCSNQAMMEVGALICRKRNPQCAACPLQADCAAHAAGLEHAFPEPIAKGLRHKRQWRLAIELREATSPPGGSELLLERRLDNATVLAGCWLPPTFKEGNEVKPSPDDRELGRFKHAITRTDYSVRLLERPAQAAVTRDGLSQGGSIPERRWVSLADFDDQGRWCGPHALPTSSMLHKTVVALRAAQIV